jgi:hypothetical protein
MSPTRRRAVPRGLAAALLLGAACSEVSPPPSAPAEPMVAVASSRAASSPAAVQRVPVKGSYAGTVGTTLLSTNPLVYRLDIEADGVTSYLGRNHAAWAVPSVQFSVGAGQLTVLSGAWHGTLTAANGDQVFGDYQFRSPTIAFDALGDFTAVADLVVTGGTGRFRRSTGDGVALIRGNVFTERFTIELDGRAAIGGP